MSTIVSFDYAIKNLLRNKGDYDIVEGFISIILKDAGYSAVKITAVLESESNKEKATLKSSVADVVVEDEQGHKYIVEIDRSHTDLFLKKACFNSSRLIVDSISKSEDYATIKKVFHINLLYFPFANMKVPLYHGKTIFREVDREHPMHLHLADMGGRIFDNYNLFPEYFVISVPLFDDVVKDEMDEWLYMTKHSEVREDFKSPYMKKIAEKLSILKMTPKELKAYRDYMNKTLKERDYIVSAEEKGKVEGKAELIKMMIKQGKSVKQIAEFTGLSEDEIEKLKEERDE
ncbi:Rpn family recombination-promoting nuclease/putative transposase [Rickettsia endosymbiont of Polydrusus tereticollis]|uniref:Rpn family recombination-promoting nuclease/putative transposase n=1 Tax=Rickettsia endosymbiont of Polydrusus tereticollis TaxID=3066251 RepID=UPI0031333E03